jgi:hypothetical protein
MTRALDLLRSHRYDEAIVQCERGLASKPDDITLAAILASALRAKGEYEKALPFFELVDQHERRDRVAVGLPGRQIDISCLHWLLEDRVRAIEIMSEVVRGTQTGRIRYGDAAGGVTQGLLLYYMGVSTRSNEAIDLSVRYLKGRSKRKAIRLWPGPVARYYLGELEFQDVLVEATGHSDLVGLMETARENLLRRRQLCVALFHDGVHCRAQGREEQCLERMRECRALEDPLIEHEWYLARGEVEHAE